MTQTKTFKVILEEKGEDALYPTTIPQALRDTIYDWFQNRHVGNDTYFPIYFRRLLLTEYPHYAQLLRIEPGVAKYDWLVEHYEEMLRTVEREGTGTKTSATTKSGTENGTSGNTRTIANEQDLTHGGTLTNVRTPNITNGHTVDESNIVTFDTDLSGTKKGTDTTTNNYSVATAYGKQTETRESGNDTREISRTGADTTEYDLTDTAGKTGTDTKTIDLRETHTGTDTMQHSVNTTDTSALSGTDTFGVSYNTDIAHSGKDKLVIDGTEGTSRNITDTTRRDTIDTTTRATTITTTHGGIDKDTVEHTGKDTTESEGTTTNDEVGLTKVNPMSASYTYTGGSAAGGGASGNAGATVPALSWTTPSTQAENLAQGSNTGKNTVTHGTKDETSTEHGHTITETPNGHDTVEGKGSIEVTGTGGIIVDTDREEERTLDTHETKTGGEITTNTYGKIDTQTHTGGTIDTTTHGETIAHAGTEATGYDTTETNTKTGTETITHETTDTDDITYGKTTNEANSGTDTTTTTGTVTVGYDTVTDEKKTGTESTSTTAANTDTLTGTDTNIETDARTQNTIESGTVTDAGNTTRTASETGSGTENTTNAGNETEKVVKTGRHGNIAAMLQQAKDFIITSNAWTWLRMELESCFMGVYDFYEEY